MRGRPRVGEQTAWTAITAGQKFPADLGEPFDSMDLPGPDEAAATLANLDLPRRKHPVGPALADRRLEHRRLAPDAGKTMKASKAPVIVQQRAVGRVCRLCPIIARVEKVGSGQLLP